MYDFQDSDGMLVASLFFVTLVLTCAILFINIIVAVLFDNYEDHDEESRKEELLELEEKALSLGVPQDICDIIIKNDIILEAKAKSSKLITIKKYFQSLFTWKKNFKYPDSTYFNSKYTKFLYKLVNHPAFTLFIFIVIGLNTITLCLDIYTKEDGKINFGFLTYTNFIFFSIFTLEVIIKLMGFGIREFVKDRFNIFDAFIVLISLIEIIISSGSGTYTSLRAFRLFRIFKVFRVGDLRVMIDCLTKTMRSISPFVICLSIFMYIFTLMGMQFFSGKIKFNDQGTPDENGTSPRFNFDTFDKAFLSVFITLTGENWDSLMYNAMRSTNAFASIYFVALMVLGKIIIIQLLVAIVINNFDQSHKATEKRKIIDSIESSIENGKSVYSAINEILGNVCHVADGEEEEIGINITLGRKTIKFKRKTSYNSDMNIRIPSQRSVVYQPPMLKKTALDNSPSVKDRTENGSGRIIVNPQPKKPSKFYNINVLKGNPFRRNDSNLFDEDEKEFESEIEKERSVHLDEIMISDKIIDRLQPTATPSKSSKNKLMRIQEEQDEEDSEDERFHKKLEEAKNRMRESNSYEVSSEECKISHNDINPEINFEDELSSRSEISEQNNSNMILTWKQKVWDYMKDSSLFILPSQNRFLTPEDIIVLEKANKTPERYGIEDMDQSQVLKTIQINGGKIMTTQGNKRRAKIFEIFIVVIILLSCIILSIDTPLNNPNTTLARTLGVIDIIFSVVFIVEATLKILALGFIRNNYQGVNAYILNGWNLLDFMVVVMSVIDIYFTHIVSGSSNAENLSSFKSLRAIRALRPLRMVSRSEGLKIAIQALFASVPAMGNVIIICLLFLLIFAILGVNFFIGAYYYCTIDTFEVNQVVEEVVNRAQ